MGELRNKIFGLLPRRKKQWCYCNNTNSCNDKGITRFVSIISYFSNTIRRAINLILYFWFFSVSNGWSGSKLLINEDIPEITEYLSKYTQIVIFLKYNKLP